MSFSKKSLSRILNKYLVYTKDFRKEKRCSEDSDLYGNVCLMITRTNISLGFSYIFTQSSTKFLIHTYLKLR